MFFGLGVDLILWVVDWWCGWLVILERLYWNWFGGVLYVESIGWDGCLCVDGFYVGWIWFFIGVYWKIGSVGGIGGIKVCWRVGGFVVVRGGNVVVRIGGGCYWSEVIMVMERNMVFCFLWRVKWGICIIS